MLNPLLQMCAFIRANTSVHCPAWTNLGYGYDFGDAVYLERCLLFAIHPFRGNGPAAVESGLPFLLKESTVLMAGYEQPIVFVRYVDPEDRRANLNPYRDQASNLTITPSWFHESHCPTPAHGIITPSFITRESLDGQDPLA
ncbi:hypothetical protein WM019_03525 [Bifidobacterium mongoliense]|uniref:hypothetical protein n=1 Tax=Bifidobacterium mongoliense TaxID=518643 RepID=UPI0030EF2793